MTRLIDNRPTPVSLSSFPWRSSSSRSQIVRNTSDMPPDRTRTSNPQGRQKSCSECAKAKRRCDLEQPHCLRCTRQKLTCVYPLQPHASVPRSLATSEDTPVATEDADDVDEPFAFDLDIPAVPTTPNVEMLNFDIPTNTSYLGVIDNEPQDNNVGKIIDVPSPRNWFVTVKQNRMFMLSPLAESRVGYSLQQLKATPRMMVESNSTHWSHPKLYDDYMPRSLQGA